MRLILSALYFASDLDSVDRSSPLYQLCRQFLLCSYHLLLELENLITSPRPYLETAAP
jgi:hypothetical protein